MSQMYPSSSHQLVAAAFRRARKKFPKNFGQLDWPINYTREDSSKSEPFSSTTTMSICKNCEERFSCKGEIRNSRSSNVWPSLRKRSDPRSTQSMRQNGTSSIRRNSNEPEIKTSGMPSARSVCPCRRNICKSWKKQNFAVSFDETNDRSQDRRISGGDARVETISWKTRPDRVTNDCTTIENRMRPNLNSRHTGKTTKKRKNHTFEKKARSKSDSSVGDDTLENSEKIQHLDLLYDPLDKSKSVCSSFSSTPIDYVYIQNASREARREFPSKLNQWETRTNSFESKIDRKKVHRRSERDSKNSHYSNTTNGQFRGESTREEHRHLHKTERSHRDSSTSKDGKPRSSDSRSSSFGGTSRLCKDCFECSRNSSRLVSSLRGEVAYEREDEPEDRVFQDQEVCAIKHKDSMAILVEKFKNKKIGSSDDETTIYKSEENCSENESTTKLVNKREKSPNFGDSSTEEENESGWIKSRKPKSVLGQRKYSGAFKSRTRSSDDCCFTKEI